MRKSLLLLVARSFVFAAPARAAFFIYTIDPTQSFVSAAGSEVLIDLGGALGTIVLDVEPQLGNALGVAGALLADGTNSDGLRTTLEGQLLVDRSPGTIRFRTRLTDIRLQPSGDWLPGTPGSEPTPQAAQLGVFLADPGLGVSALAAVRDAAFVYFSGVLPLVSIGPGASSFDAAQILRTEAGALDFDTSLAGVAGRDFLASIAGLNTASSGVLETPGGSFERITIPIDLTLLLGPEFFEGLPLSANLRLGGQIVATYGVIPEPATALLLLADLGGLGLGGTRRGARGGFRRRSRKDLLVRVLLILPLLAACPPAEPETCNNGFDDDSNGLVDCDDPSCEFDPLCTAEQICDDALDDDADGATDCADSSCDDDPACGPVASPVTSIDCASSSGITAIEGPNSESSSECGGSATASDGASVTTIEIRDASAAEETSSGKHEVALLVTHRRVAPAFGVGFGDVIFTLLYQPGGNYVLVGARSLTFGTAFASPPSIFVLCPEYIDPVEIPLDATPIALPRVPAGGSCEAFVSIGCSTSDVGDSACQSILYAIDPDDLCEQDADCGSAAVCGPDDVCHDGEDLDPCASPYDCNQAGGWSCTEAGVCTDGSPEDPCNVELADFECAGDLLCDDGRCRSEDCNDGVDNDADGQFDCDDVDCDGAGFSFHVCGDGNLDYGEDCDDGNTQSGDGCSDLCTLEF